MKSAEADQSTTARPIGKWTLGNEACTPNSIDHVDVSVVTCDFFGGDAMREFYALNPPYRAQLPSNVFAALP
jgi:hypothetical protein